MASVSSWFEELFGFEETDPYVVRENLVVEGTTLHSRANGRHFEVGRLEIPTLDDLRREASATGRSGETTVEEWVIDAAALHQAAEASESLIQVASQFNLLEMIAPEIAPEDGITGYSADRTQGPACAMAAAAGTVFRCHLVPLDGPVGPVGQTRDRQIDCLREIGAEFGNHDGRLWKMVNGYALATDSGLSEIASRLDGMNKGRRDALMGRLQIGLQWNTEVTSVTGSGQRVSQAYCSALPVAYSEFSESRWEPFAKLVLDGAYEATLAAGVLNAERTGNRFVFLTLLGGGAFGNRFEWIVDSLLRGLRMYRDAGLRVVVVSYRKADERVAKLIGEFCHEAK